MRYQELKPHPALRPYVVCVWILRDDAPLSTRPVERILPDGNLELIVHFGDPFEKLSLRGQFERQWRALFAGQLESFTLLRASGRVGTIGVRFRPGGVAPFFAFPLDAATDHVLPLDDVLGRSAATLEDQVLDARSDADRAVLVQRFLLNRLSGQADPVVATVVARIQAAEGTAPPAELFRGLAPSTRQIERRFLRHVGVSARTLSRIARFQKALRLLGAERPVRLTEVGYDCGYYDQSHFIRDFRDLSGLSPKAYRRETHPLADFFQEHA